MITTDVKSSVNRPGTQRLLLGHISRRPIDKNKQTGVIPTNTKRECLAYHTKNTKRTTNVWQQANILTGHRELLLSTVKRRKLSWFVHVCRQDTLPKIILQGTVGGSGRGGRSGKSWRATSGNGQASHCRHCCATQVPEVDGRPSQPRRLLEYHNDA